MTIKIDRWQNSDRTEFFFISDSKFMQPKTRSCLLNLLNSLSKFIISSQSLADNKEILSDKTLFYWESLHVGEQGTAEGEKKPRTNLLKVNFVYCEGFLEAWLRIKRPVCTLFHHMKIINLAAELKRNKLPNFNKFWHTQQIKYEEALQNPINLTVLLFYVCKHMFSWFLRLYYQ